LRTKWESAVQAQVTKRFEQEAKQVVEAVRGSPDAKSVETRVLNAIDEKAWQQLYKAVYIGIIEDFANRTLQELKSDLSIQTKKNIWLSAALEFVKSAVTRVTQVIETTKNQINEVITKALINGDSIDQIANNISQLYEEMGPRRAETIARTETLSASSYGGRVAAKSTGLPLKKTWLATRDNRTRNTHRHIDGEIKGIDELYSNGLMYPADLRGTSSEVINCRCSEFYTVIKKSDNNQR
jgi:SPP1 gp7 family putative phage head morphogenesis protein